jgi:hypothetical protein
VLGGITHNGDEYHAHEDLKKGGRKGEREGGRVRKART